ncbi:hypothetical protein J2T13_002001 [Paenibacillus sp. DS2015]|uniref:hypothetical protein n=1 Tax=Paenibacillus sp. DS2015 TaxID=3373917 RepID=UPI003D20AF16
MKITDFSIIFVCMMFPLFMIMEFHVQDQREVQLLEMKYRTALRTAVQDGGRVLHMNEQQEMEAGYHSEKYFRADKELALSTFQHTLYMNMEIEDDPVAQGSLQTYIPVIVVMDYDGYYVYTSGEYQDDEGNNLREPLWMAKKPYTYSDALGNSIHFTLDTYIEAFDARIGEWVKGLAGEIGKDTTIPLLQEHDKFEQVRRASIVSSIQEDLAYYINRHNEWAARNGISYLFTLPSISQEEWNNSVDDIGMMAFIQGVPVGDRYYNDYALGGGRLVKVHDIYAGVDKITGIKYFYRSSCSFPQVRIEEVYPSEKNAAAAGYYEKTCENKVTP